MGLGYLLGRPGAILQALLHTLFVFRSIGRQKQAKRLALGRFRGAGETSDPAEFCRRTIRHPREVWCDPPLVPSNCSNVSCFFRDLDARENWIYTTTLQGSRRHAVACGGSSWGYKTSMGGLARPRTYSFFHFSGFVYSAQ